MRISVTELSRNPNAAFAALERGETVLITRRGRVVAELVTAKEKPRVPITEDPAFGLWKDREDMKDAGAWVREQRKARFPGLRRAK
jgi:antitoxin (DNA-binding transcriptional repressor) of toxin-antitoxin stability system